ncbi:MAG: DUF4954 family protein [Bacteroidota bacterium]
MPSEQHINQLTLQGCSADDWSMVTIASGSDLSRINNVHFSGTVSVGDISGTRTVDGVELPCGLSHATIANCTIGNHVRIANVGSVVAGYLIEDGVVIQDVGSLSVTPGTPFGNGIEIEAINEGGGRGIRIISDLTSQAAYLQGALRHDPEFVKKLSTLIDGKISATKVEKGIIGTNARVLHCGSIQNVMIGPSAFIHGAQSLREGTIASCAEHPTEIGEGVQATSFMVAEGARIDNGVILDKVFVGQGVKMGKGFSAENSLFFANCEAFHGEAVAVFAGPYTVTHHKSTLLIAGMFSFYNAGSGTNQSNHMYKLGPVHQGLLERGCKTGSFSYLLLESHIPAFSVVIGKHFTNINIPNLPFSYIHEEQGVSKVIPGMNLFSVGTVRDGEKWPKRDNRKAPIKRDLIIFDVFSPYTVEKMRRGRDELLALSESVPKEKAFITYGGLQLNRLLLKKGAKYYSLAIKRYLNAKVTDRLKESLTRERDWKRAVASLTPSVALTHSAEWTDIAGLLMPREQLAEIEQHVINGRIASYEQLQAAFRSSYDRYPELEWRYLYDTFVKEYGIRPDEMTVEQALKAIDEWEQASSSLHGMILEDSKKEFGSFAQIGYGIDQPEQDRLKDFEAVRGTAGTNGVVQKLVKEGAAIPLLRTEFESLVASFSTT